ncbi:MAG TPA: CPBP family intramembrane glutamic endopeptidase [Candidatus Eisenbacteria bacterium]|nr:CPBP family intramembrane glutamic endopeptidase [Candidatus Eisenbacteria bacterium]
MLFALCLPAGIVIGLHGLFGVIQFDAALTVEDELIAKGTSAVFVLLATWIVSRMQRRPLDDYGIPPRQSFGLRFWEGATWGFAMLTLLLVAIRATGHFHVEGAALAGATAFRYALGWALVFVLVSFSEELTFRGYLLRIAAHRMRFWRAAIALSIGFAVAHLANPGETLIGISQVFGTGMLFCFMICRTGNLWFVLGYHAAWDWAQTYFYGTADSGLKSVGYLLNTSTNGPAWLTGGATGPEGSLMGLAILVLVAVLIHFRFPTVLYPDRPE